MGSLEEDPRGKVPFLPQHMRGTCRQHCNTGDIHLDDLAEVVVVSFLPCEASFCFPLPVLSALEGSHAT